MGGADVVLPLPWPSGLGDGTGSERVGILLKGVQFPDGQQMVGTIALPSGLCASTIARVSVASDGTQANATSRLQTMSADGNMVAFESTASNLVGGDANGAQDVFVHGRLDGITERISVAFDGADSNGNSQSPRISGNGRVVAFSTFATNLVPGDVNGRIDAFARDRDAGTTELISVATDGTHANVNNSFAHRPSFDGRFVPFVSYATTLVPGDSNSSPDAFLRDRLLGTTERVNVATSSGAQANHEETSAHMSIAVSADGRFVVFSSDASNLVPGDTNGALDIFVRDRAAGTTERVNVASDGAQAAPGSSSHGVSISDDGRWVTFLSDAANLVPDDTNGMEDAFLHDRSSGTTERVSVASNGDQANAPTKTVRVAPDGAFVAFSSTATNLSSTPGDGGTGVYIHDRVTGTTERIVDDVLDLGDGDGDVGTSNPPVFAISADRRFIAFMSDATDLVPNDTNAATDVFVYDRQAH